jgi:lysozyme
MLRAFEGKDPDEVPGGYSFEALRQQPRAAGLIVGAYQYFRARHPGDWQAGLLLKALGRLEPGELPPALDVEELDGQTAEKARSEILAWVLKVWKTIEEPPILYTGPFFWTKTLKGAELVELADCPLWIADYRKNAAPEIPRPFTRPLLWQTTDKGRFAGVVGSVDANRWIAPELPQDWAERHC